MRVNVYAEEMTGRIEIIGKEIDGHTFTGLRFYLELPVTLPEEPASPSPWRQVRGPFVHRPGGDDSAAVTFWGKRDLREVLRKALAMLDEHYTLRGEHHPKSETVGMAEYRDYILRKHGVSLEEYERRVMEIAKDLPND
jgi:hypothetical protein